MRILIYSQKCIWHTHGTINTSTSLGLTWCTSLKQATTITNAHTDILTFLLLNNVTGKCRFCSVMLRGHPCTGPPPLEDHRCSPREHLWMTTSLLSCWQCPDRITCLFVCGVAILLHVGALSSLFIVWSIYGMLFTLVCFFVWRSVQKGQI